MALTTTTLSSAAGATDNSLVLTSATGVSAGSLILVDGELCQVTKSYVSGTTVPVLRGQDGTVAAAHKASANATIGLASDFANPGPQALTTYPALRPRQVVSYSASGAIALPTGGYDLTVILNGTSTLAMTVAVPTKDMDGALMYVVANGKAAHTVTFASGLGNGSTASDVATFSTSYAGGMTVMAANGFWVLVGNGIYSATSPTGAPTIA